MDDGTTGTLEAIEALTLQAAAPYTVSAWTEKVQSGYKQYETADRLTTYLILAYKGRVLFYGVEVPKKRFTIPSLSGDPECEEYLAALYTPCLFAHRGDISIEELKDIVHADSDYEICSLKALAPGEEETDDGFFLRNAMWLVNALIH